MPGPCQPWCSLSSHPALTSLPCLPGNAQLLQAVSSHGPHNVHILLTAPCVDSAGLTQHWQHLQQHQQHLQHLLDAEVLLSAGKPVSKSRGTSDVRPTTSTSQLKTARSAAPTLALPSGSILVLASAPSLPAPPRHSLSEPELRPGCERASSELWGGVAMSQGNTRYSWVSGGGWALRGRRRSLTTDGWRFRDRVGAGRVASEGRMVPGSRRPPLQPGAVGRPHGFGWWEGGIDDCAAWGPQTLAAAGALALHSPPVHLIAMHGQRNAGTLPSC